MPVSGRATPRHSSMYYTPTVPCYSPSQTKDFLRDPGMWYFHYVEKWRPRYIGKKEVAGMLGTAIADGAAVFHNFLKSHGVMQAGKEEAIKKAAAVAIQSANDEKALVIKRGQSVYDDQAENWELLPKRAAEGVFKYALNFPSAWVGRVLEAELTLPAHGYCRPDLVVDTDFGPMVVDLKTKLTLDLKYQAKTLREFAEDWQFFHYAWAYHDYLWSLAPNEPAPPALRQFCVYLLVLEPKGRVPTPETYPINPEIMALWKHSAVQVWRLMAAMRAGEPITIDPLPWSTFNFYSKFGREDWADAFTKYFLDPGLLTAAYTREQEK